MYTKDILKNDARTFSYLQTTEIVLRTLWHNQGGYSIMESVLYALHSI
jgi:hypothetical protein